MKKILVCLYDNVAHSVCGEPFAVTSQDEAQRALVETLRDPRMKDTMIVHNPQDFEVRYVCDFDTDTGRCEVPHDVGDRDFFLFNLNAINVKLGD